MALKNDNQLRMHSTAKKAYNATKDKGVTAVKVEYLGPDDQVTDTSFWSYKSQHEVIPDLDADFPMVLLSRARLTEIDQFD